MSAYLSNDVISKIADLVSFEKMKKDNSANMSWNRLTTRGGEAKFMRKGTVGDWKNFLSPEESAQMDRICAERLGDTGLTFEFE